MDLTTFPTPPPWVEQAACNPANADDWFPRYARDAANPIEACRHCPVNAQCLQTAIDNGETWGIWGGRDFETNRRAIKDRKAPVCALEGCRRQVPPSASNKPRKFCCPTHQQRANNRAYYHRNKGAA